jgi:hypothetical protein
MSTSDPPKETARAKLERRILNGERRAKYRDEAKANAALPPPEPVVSILEGKQKATRGERIALQTIRALLRDERQRAEQVRQIVYLQRLKRELRKRQDPAFAKRILLLEKLRRLEARQMAARQRPVSRGLF